MHNISSLGRESNLRLEMPSTHHLSNTTKDGIISARKSWMLAPPRTMLDAQHWLWVVPSNFKDAQQHLLREEKARLKGEDSLYKIIRQLSSHSLEKYGRQGKTGYQHGWHCNHLLNRETWQTGKDGVPWQMTLSKENRSWSMSFEPRPLAIKVAITTLWVGSKNSNASELIFWLPVGWLAHLFVHTKRFEEIRNQALKKNPSIMFVPFFQPCNSSRTIKWDHILWNK